MKTLPFLVVSAFLAAVIVPTAHSLSIPMTVRDLAVTADSVILGTVSEIVQPDPEAWILDIRVAVEDAAKGAAAKGGFFHYQIPGGVVAGRKLVSSETPYPELGDRVILFLADEESGLQPYVGGSQGCLDVSDGRLAGKGLTAEGLMDSIRSMLAEAPTGKTDIPLGAVSAPLSTLSYERLCASCAGYPEVCLEWFSETYRFGVEGGVFINPNCGDSYASDKTEIDAVRRAMTTWNEAGSRFSFDYSGETSLVPFHTGDDPNLSDGVTVFGWTNLSLGAGVLARCHTIFECDTGEIVEADVEFGDVHNWSALETPPGGLPEWYDIETIALHEMGHGFGLDHNPDYESIMYYSVSQRTLKRSLHSTDVDGIRDIYGKLLILDPPTSGVEEFWLYR